MQLNSSLFVDKWTFVRSEQRQLRRIRLSVQEIFQSFGFPQAKLVFHQILAKFVGFLWHHEIKIQALHVLKTVGGEFLQQILQMKLRLT